MLREYLTGPDGLEKQSDRGMVRKHWENQRLDEHSWGNPIMGVYATEPRPIPQGFGCLGKKSGSVLCSDLLLHMPRASPKQLKT